MSAPRAARNDEAAIIGRFTAAFGRPSPPVVLGPGDDCALLRPRPGEVLALTTDALVEGVHFSPAFSPADIGHKALAVNLSDLAAMGARPVAFLCALAFPERWLPHLSGIARGMARLARAHGCALAGGNVSRARELSVTITAVGAVPVGQALTRAGARPGHALYLSGPLGGAAAGLRSQAPAHRSRQRRPRPRVALGLALRGVASAAIDVSDGLVRDLGRLLDASGVGAEVEPERIPRARGATLDEALRGGEDYELLFAVPEGRAPALRAAAARCGARAPVRIGRVTRALGLAGLGPGESGGHDHFG